MKKLLPLMLLGLTVLPAPLFSAQRVTQAAGQAVTVYKSPHCGCCSGWVKHLEAAGFAVVVKDVDDVQPVKRREAVPEAVESCHTARVGKYTVEGHVPAHVIKRMLRERPAIRGIAVPGMPAGSPGMESMTPVRYQVLAFKGDGSTSVYATIDPSK